MTESNSEKKSRVAGKLRIGDHWNAINIIARTQTHPLKAVCELVENAFDAGAREVDSTGRVDMPGGAQPLNGVGGQHDEIERLTCLHAPERVDSAYRLDGDRLSRLLPIRICQLGQNTASSHRRDARNTLRL